NEAQSIGNQDFVICDQHFELHAHESPARPRQNYRSEFANTLQFRLQRPLHPAGPPLATSHPAYIRTIYAEAARHTRIQTAILNVSRQFASFAATTCHH
ncbi:MAG TPA: hypothetical protein VJN48_15440, partial [Terriglobales bacterium]|nr:hypothetical protein [Terriglobales bacterium]